jgi:uncharacterized membrane protein YheB (UPF0754 family)
MPDWIPSFFHWVSIHIQSLFASPSIFFWKVALPPILYAVHGYFATWMAVACLFRPYEPKYFMGYQLPWSPGIFPKRRSKLAQAVAATITDTLLTPADIKAKAETLVTETNIYLSIDLFVDSVLKEFRDTTKLHRLASDLAELSPTLLQYLVISTVDGLEKGKDQKVAAITEKIFDQIILTMRIPLDQANEIASRLMEAFATPAKVRNALIALLTPQNISALEESIQAHAGGPYRILARIIGIKRVCYEWRNFLEKQPTEAEKIIGDMIKRFGIKDQIALQIANFDVRAMPLQSIAKLKKNIITFVESFLLHHRDDILESVKRIEVEAMGTVRAAIIRFNPESIPPAWLVRAKQDIAAFAYAYLKRELGELLERAIPALGMYTLIEQKIDMFSSQQLERVVVRICEQELKLLKWLGAVIGFMLGLIQILINAFGPQ